MERERTNDFFPFFFLIRKNHFTSEMISTKNDDQPKLIIIGLGFDQNQLYGYVNFKPYLYHLLRYFIILNIIENGMKLAIDAPM